MSVSIRSTTIAVAVALVVACGGGGGSSSGTNETIKLWYAGPLTGGNAQLGGSGCQGAQLAAEDINNRGAIRSGPHKGAKLSVQCVDDQQSADVEATIASRYVSDPSVWT